MIPPALAALRRRDPSQTAGGPAPEPTEGVLAGAPASLRIGDAGALTGDALWYVLSKALPGAVGLLSVVLFLRLVGAEQYGRYALAVSAVTAVSALSTAWLAQALLRYHARIAGMSGADAALWLGAAASLVGGTGILLLVRQAGMLDGFPADAFLLVVAMFVLISLFQLRISALVAQIAPRRVVLLTAVQSVLAIVLPLGLLLVARSYLMLLAGICLANLVALLALSSRSWFATAPPAAASMRRQAARVVRPLWRFGWPLSLWFACVSAVPLGDRYLIQRFFDFSAAGSYAGAYDMVVRSYSLLLFPVVLAAHPRLMRLWNEDRRAEAGQLLKRAILIQLGMFAVLAPLFLVAWTYIMPVIVPGAAGSLSLIALLLTGGFLWQLAMLAHKPLECAGRTGRMLTAAAIALIVHLSTALVLLPRVGVYAAAQALVASGLVYVGLCVVFTPRALFR